MPRSSNKVVAPAVLPPVFFSTYLPGFSEIGEAALGYSGERANVVGVRLSILIGYLFYPHNASCPLGPSATISLPWGDVNR
jgi:hypothetical protein